MTRWLSRKADYEVDVLFGIVTGAAGALFVAGIFLGFFTWAALLLYVPGMVLTVLQVVIRREMARRRADR